MLLRKVVLFYEYRDGRENFYKTQFPPKSVFYSQLMSEDINDDDYEQARTKWKEFNIPDLVEYDDSYLKLDILLLCDLFENLRKCCL